MIKKNYDDGKKHIHVLSYGGGTQSTALLIKALKGEVSGVIPDYIIMSDTGNEPRYVDEQVDRVNKYIKKKFNREIIITSGGNIYEDLLNATQTGERVAGLPFHTEDENGETGMGSRQCTGDYKITPVRNKVRELLGYKPRQKVKEIVHMWKGISTDEIQRVKPIKDKWIEAEHPLVWELSMDRSACVAYVERELGFTPFSSACIICPFHSNSAWLEIKKHDPEGFQKAAELDEKLRSGKLPFKSKVYLHKSRLPLGEVDIGEDQMGLFDMFNNECEGFCGV